MGGDGLMVGQGDCVVVVVAECLQEREVEPIGPDHGRRLGLEI